MGEQPRKTGSKPKEPDRLAEALRGKRRRLTLDGRQLTIVKWNLKTSCEMMARLGKILEKVIGSAKETLDIGAFLSKDLGSLVTEHYDDIVAVLAHTVKRENFDDLTQAQAWIEELGLAEAVEMFSIIVEQNLRPLVVTAQSIGEKLRSVASAKAQKALRPST